MPWFRVDEGFMDHPKVVGLQQSVTPARFTNAITLWIAAGTWCARNLSDGVIPAVKLKQVAPISRWKRAALDLVSVGLWTRIEPENAAIRDGESYSFHDWHIYQPSAAKVREKREKDAEKKRRMRAGNGNCPQGTTSGTPPPRPALTDPDPVSIPKQLPSVVVDERASAPDDDVGRLAQVIRSWPAIADVLSVSPERQAETWLSWFDPMRPERVEAAADVVAVIGASVPAGEDPGRTLQRITEKMRWRAKDVNSGRWKRKATELNQRAEAEDPNAQADRRRARERADAAAESVPDALSPAETARRAREVLGGRLTPKAARRRPAKKVS